jgi:membrane-bound lytic murein transglycosylase B
MTVSEWASLGVNPFGGARWSPAANALEGKLLVPAGHLGPKFLTFKNFDVIKKYNNSTSYAMGINVLAEGLKERPAISGLWPKNDKQLSLTEKETLQRRLTALGYDTKGVDGQIGPNSRRAIRAWQTANGVPADGYVEQRLFRRIMGR